MFGVKVIWWLAMMPEGSSTGFTNPAMLLRCFFFRTKSVPEHWIFPRIMVVALLMVNGERQAAPALNHTLV